MPPKRRADDITSHKPKKILIIEIDESDERKQLNDFGKKKREELEHALDVGDDDRVLKLGLEFMDWQMSSSNLAKRLQSFIVEKTTNHDLVRKLLEHQNPDLWTPVGGVLLWQAVKSGDIEIAKMLVRAGTDLSVKESTNNSTILHAVLSSEKIGDQVQKENLILLMLEHGADINAVDKNGYSILNRVIREKSSTSTTFIKRLLQLGANVRIEDDNRKNDIYYALQYKPELVLRLIQHQVPNEEARNRRGVVAIEYLITEKCAGKLEMIKNILDLGVPINNSDPKNPLGNNGCSLLHSALDAKKIDVIKLLLQNGADVHQKDDAGITPLFKAAKMFKPYSRASRLLINHGASVNECNSDGRYPIHAACKNESLRNVHLLLSLGASLAVTDSKGSTPFDGMTINNLSLTDAGRLVIKHFALMASKGVALIDKDLIKIKKCYDVLVFFNSCLEELNNMKMTMCDNIPYFFLLSENVNDRLLVVKNANLVRAFNENTQLHELFLIYFFNLKISLEIAGKQLKILKFMEEILKQVFGQIFPKSVIDKIAYHASLKNMMDCEKSSFLALHENAKHNQTGKRIMM